LFGLRLEVLQLLGAFLALVGIYLGMRASAHKRSTPDARQ